MEKLARIHALKWRKDALLAQNLLDYYRLLLIEEVEPHIEAALASCLKPGAAAEYHWAHADSYISFIENGQKQLSAMVEEARRLSLVN